MVNKRSAYAGLMEEDAVPDIETSKEFQNYFVGGLKEIYWNKKFLSKALVKLKKLPVSAEVKNFVVKSLTNTDLQMDRLYLVFDLLGEPARTVKGEAIAGIIEQLFKDLEGVGKADPMRDAMILNALTRTTLYEVASCEQLLQLAQTMGNEDVIALLEETLREEKEAAESLSALAENVLTAAA